MDVLIAVKNLHCLSDLIFVSITTDVKEVSRHATLQLDNIHGSHSETSAVNHAADIAIQSDVVQVVFISLDFSWVFLFIVKTSYAVNLRRKDLYLRNVIEFEEFLLSKFGVVIDIDFAIAN
mgnify:CR=1 FL=1